MALWLIRRSVTSFSLMIIWLKFDAKIVEVSHVVMLD